MDSTYKIIELIGTSPNSWEEAAKKAPSKQLPRASRI